MTAIADEHVATMTLRIAYDKTIPGYWTSRVHVEVIDSSIPLPAERQRNSTRVWGGPDGERIGSALHHAIVNAAEFVLETWADAAETLHRKWAERAFTDALDHRMDSERCPDRCTDVFTGAEFRTDCLGQMAGLRGDL